MDIEAIVKKHARLADGMRYWDAELLLRSALTELAAGYEQKIAGLESEAILSRALSERIRQLDARLGGYLTVGGGHIVHGTAEALARVQAYILLDSKHPIEARDTNRYFAKQLQTAEQRIRQLEAERVPEGWQLVPVEPTPDMIDAVLWYANGDYLKLLDEDLLRIEIRHDWRAMLAAAPRRCHLCDYQHGHKIGCVNNPVDIALRAAAPQPKKEGE